MQNKDTLYSLVTASVLIGLLIAPSMAQDAVQMAPMHMQPMMPAPMPAMQAPPQQPNYVWQGNRISNPPPGVINAQPTAQHSAQAVSGLPEAVQKGNVRFITGGIGDEERDALNAVKDNYNLHITSTNNSGEFESDLQINIRDRSGNSVLTAVAGPIFYADLPAGTYTVEASAGGQVRTKKVSVGTGKSAKVYLRW